MVRYVSFLVWLSIACGEKETVKIVEIEKPVGQSPGNPPNSNPPAASPILDWNTISPILQDNCGQAGCHAGADFLSDETRFFNSNSPNRIRNGSMPPQYSPDLDQWTPEIQGQVIQYLDASR